MPKGNHREKKELHELRLLGAAPAAVDESGNMINPHMPNYMSRQPWYLTSAHGEGLGHHRVEGNVEDMEPGPLFEEYTKTGVKTGGTRLKKWRKGACENCGCPTHKTQNCVERRRRRTAKLTNREMMPEEYVPQQFKHNWDSKRDRWAGFDADVHQAAVIDRYSKIENLRKKKRAEEFERKIREGDAKTKKKFKKKLRKLKGVAAGLSTESSDSDSDSDDDDDSDIDDMKDSGTVMNLETSRQTVRNLRLREDLPKYLRNLDPQSAFYDPKSRSMRSNPYANDAEKNEQSTYHGDNFERFDGESQDYYAQRRFAGLARQQIGEDAGGAVHQASNPTMAESVFKKQMMKRGDIKEKIDTTVHARYGGEEHMRKPDFSIQQKEVYREFAPDGKVIKGPKFVTISSKYVEDEHPGNHSSVWGSWFDRKGMKWGFACCRQTLRNSYCTATALTTKERVVVAHNKRKRRAPIGAQNPPPEYTSNVKRTAAGYTKTQGILAGLAEYKKRKVGE